MRVGAGRRSLRCGCCDFKIEVVVLADRGDERPRRDRGRAVISCVMTALWVTGVFFTCALAHEDRQVVTDPSYGIPDAAINEFGEVERYDP